MLASSSYTVAASVFIFSAAALSRRVLARSCAPAPAQNQNLKHSQTSPLLPSKLRFPPPRSVLLSVHSLLFSVTFYSHSSPWRTMRRYVLDIVAPPPLACRSVTPPACLPSAFYQAPTIHCAANANCYLHSMSTPLRAPMPVPRPRTPCSVRP